MQQISPIKKRILETIENKGFSKYEFYQKTGITRGVLDKETGISEDNIAKYIAYFSEVNTEWLLTGKGPMIKQGEEKQLLTINADNADYLKKNGIPLIPVEAMAGVGGNGDIQIVEEEIQDYFVVPKLQGIADCAFTVNGDSMSNTYLRGDYVLCKRIILSVDFIQWNQAYVLDSTQGNLVKRIKKSTKKDHLLCHSDNLNFGEFDIPITCIRNLAIVLGVIRLE